MEQRRKRGMVMKNYSNPTSIRFNPEREKDLVEFIEQCGGVKKALMILFNHYKVTRELPNLLKEYIHYREETVNQLPEDLKVVKKVKDLVDYGILSKEEFYDKIKRLFD